MKWKMDTYGRAFARCGHLYVLINEIAADQCSWFVAPDGEDKSYRRALAEGNATSIEKAKAAALDACQGLLADMQRSLVEDANG